MATKSFLKSVNIRKPKQARRFIDALEKAEQFSRQEKIQSSRTAYEVKGEDVAAFMKKVKRND